MFLHTIFFTLLLFTGKPDIKFTPALSNAYELLLKLKIDSAKIIIDHELHSTAKTDLTIPSLLANYVDFLTLMISEDEVLYQKLKANQYNRIQYLNTTNKKGPYYRYVLGEVYLQWALVKIKFGNETDGGLDLIKAYHLFEKNEILFPSFVYHKKSLGLLHTLLGVVPNKYKWIVKTLGFNPDANLGMKELNVVLDNKNEQETEALFIKEWLSNYVLKQSASENELKNLLSQHPDNLLAAFLLASVLKKSGKGTQALALLNNFNYQNHLYFPYIDHFKATLELQKGDYTLAIADYKKFLMNYRGENLKKDACYKLYLAYRLSGNSSEAEKYFKMIPATGKTAFDNDKYAQKAALSKHKSDDRLIKARLLCDGGYYKEALAILEACRIQDFSGLSDKIEFHYRKGRIFDFLKDQKNTIVHYETAITLQADEYYYFAPNACLQLGYLYMNSDHKKATAYFKKALSYKNHEYKNSIDTKAKAALNKLKSEK